MQNRTSFYQYLSGLATALIVALVSTWLLWKQPLFWEAFGWQLIVLSLIYLISSSRIKGHDFDIGRAALLAFLPFVFILSWRVPIDIFFIYSIIWIAYVPHYFPRTYWWWSFVLVTISWYLLRLAGMEANQAILKTLLEATFHMFALVSSIAVKESEQANEKTQQLNVELLATQHLLSQASKDSERTRIARDLHDLLGHHLTALTINLQVAGRLSNGEAKDKVDQCYALSKLLLSDVRESVSRLREMPMVGLKELLEITVKDLPRISVSLELDEQLQVNDVDTAETLLRFVQEAITNTLKHSTAKHVLIKASLEDEQIQLSYSDDGGGCETLISGNGLSGMRERIECLGGSLAITNQPNLTLQVIVPLVN